MNLSQDPYYKTTIDFKHNDYSLKFKISQDLFSSHDIDVGTKLLLRSLNDTNYINFRKVLDVGSGYGPIGITIKALYPEAEVHLVDRDSLAVEYSAENAELNNIDDIKSYGSLLYSNVNERDFDFIISNIPAKIGEPAIRNFLLKSADYLTESGVVAIVVVSPLRELVKSIIENNPAIEILFNKDTPSYSVFHYKFIGDVNYKEEKNVFLRNEKTEFRFNKLKYKLTTAIGIKEFDTLNHRTEIIFDYIATIQNKKIINALVINNGQGHVAVGLNEVFKPHFFTLVDRDLLALDYTLNNLVLNNVDKDKIEIKHLTPINLKTNKEYELIVITIPDKELRTVNKALVDNALNLLSENGQLIISSSSTIVTRLIEDLMLEKDNEVIFRKRYKGQSIIAVKKR